MAGATREWTWRMESSAPGRGTKVPATRRDPASRDQAQPAAWVRPHRHATLLQFRGLIQYQDRLRIAQVTGDELLHRAKRRRVVPGVLGQQRLHPPRARVSRGLGELPARLA